VVEILEATARGLISRVIVLGVRVSELLWRAGESDLEKYLAERACRPASRRDRAERKADELRRRPALLGPVAGLRVRWAAALA
jgi:hypothetical protein